jgi:radical SAM protein with 4Fe4S-binding SPASM domain
LHNVGSRDLLTSGIDEIGISTTVFEPDMYRTIFRNNMYEQMKQNVLDLLRTNDELGRPVKISVGLRINKPIDEVLDSGGFNEVVTLADSVDANYYFDSWCGRIRPEDLTGNMKIRPLAMSHLMIKKNPCSMMYSGIGVLADGTVSACPCRDLDADSDLCIGNINNSSLHELYYSERLDALRKEWLAGAYIPDICRECTHYNPYTYQMLSEIKKQRV